MPALSDDHLQQLLDELTPAIDEQPEWRLIVAEAESEGSARTALSRFRGPRALAIAVAVVVVAVLAPLSALAVTQGWWFFRFGRAPQPISPVVVVARGVWNGASWAVTAYRSTTDGVCTAFTTRPGQANRSTGGMGCAQITGVPVTPQTKQSPPTGISYLAGERNTTAPTRFPAYAVGPVVGSAETVVLTLDDHRRLRVPTIAAPPALGANVRFFITRLPRHSPWTPGAISPLSSLVGLDRHGHVVARLTIPPRRLNTRAFQVSNNGGLLPLTPAFRHALQLAHRSTLIHELGTRDGENFYRLGGSHVYDGVAHTCWGVGRSVDPATLPATRRGVARLIGVIECTPKTATSFPSPEAPVFDLSIYGAHRGQKELTLFRLAGFASDAVKTINLLDDHGRIVERVPVVGNVYALKRAPEGVVAVVPTSFTGMALARCGPNRGTVRGADSYLQAHC
jgi:hypothetical protein